MWTCFSHCWPFGRGIHRLPVDSFYKGPLMWTFDLILGVGLNADFDVFFSDIPNKLLNNNVASDMRRHDVYVTALLIMVAKLLTQLVLKNGRFVQTNTPPCQNMSLHLTQILNKIIDCDPWLQINYTTCYYMQPTRRMTLDYDSRAPIWDRSRSFNAICAAW